MNKQKAIAKEKELLRLYKDRLVREGNEADISPVEENGLADILSVEYEIGEKNLPILCQYHFIMPSDGDVDSLMFSQSLTLIDDLGNDDIKLTMLQAANVVNFMLPIGYFAFDPNLESMSFRYTMPLQVGVEQKKLEEEMNSIARKILGIAATFAPRFIALQKGECDWNEFLKTLGAE